MSNTCVHMGHHLYLSSTSITTSYVSGKNIELSNLSYHYYTRYPEEDDIKPSFEEEDFQDMQLVVDHCPK